MANPQFITDGKGGFYLAFQTNWVSGYLPVPIPKLIPILRWHGPKINLETEWYPATTFMADYLKHEVVLRLFVTANQSEIVIRPLTQLYGTGMRIVEAPTKEDYEEISALGLTDIGTVHSHCTSKAFASGIDKKDEEEWPGGLHLTVGNLDESRYDLHARFAWDVPGEEKDGKVVRTSTRTLQTPALEDWFELPAHAQAFVGYEPSLADSILEYLITKPVIAPYPAWWKDKLVAPPPKPLTGPISGPSSVMNWEGDRGWTGVDFFGGTGGMHEGMVDPPQPPRGNRRPSKRPGP